MQFGLRTKYTLITSAMVLVVMGLHMFVHLRTLKGLWLQEEVKTVDNLSETIIRTTHYQMLEDDRARVYQMMREVGSQEEIEHVRLVNKDGIIIFSTDPNETGKFLDKDAEACNVCHFTSTPLTQAPSMNRSRVFLDRQGKEVLALAKGIYNQPQCYTAACHAHPPDAKLLGVLDVTVSLAGTNARLDSYRNDLAIFTALLLAVLITCLTCLTRIFVTRPVTRLLDHTRRLARGELEGHIEDGPKDELGKLAEAFNEMTDNLKSARNELREWAETLEVRVEERTREIKQMQSQLLHSEKLASLGELVAGIAHEVNNPLAGILMFTSLALENPKLHPSMREDLETVVRETQRCADIVRGLLEFSRQSRQQKRRESISRLLNKTLALVEHHASFLNIRVVRNYDETLPLVMVDPGQLRQVFMNIVLNAGQAMPNGGILTITTGPHWEADHLFVAVTDTGCGIREEHLPKIFDPFFTTKEHQGTGLGLAVSFGIVKSHGGRIEVQSKPGEGTTFTVVLPLHCAGEPEREVEGLTSVGGTVPT